MGLDNNGSSSIPQVYLNNGVQMPMFGLGTTHNGGYVHATVVNALKYHGYRLIDTAKRYGTETFIPCAIRDAGVDRQDMFLTTKMWPTDYGSFDTVSSAAHASMNRLDTDYLDLYLMHWPVVLGQERGHQSEVLQSTWRAMELLLDKGHCRAIGVSNFQVQDLEVIMKEASVIPQVNQCEFHPCQNPIELRRFCRQNDIQFEGHCPLAKGMLLKDPKVMDIAKRSGTTPAQVLIRWSLQNDVITIPKSTKAHRIAENVHAVNISLSHSDMNILNSMHQDMRVIDLSRLEDVVRSTKPDGYKIHHFQSELPTEHTT